MPLHAYTQDSRSLQGHKPGLAPLQPASNQRPSDAPKARTAFSRDIRAPSNAPSGLFGNPGPVGCLANRRQCANEFRKAWAARKSDLD